MTAKTSVFRLPKAAALLENRLAHFRRLLHSEMFRFNPEARDLYPDDEWIYSTVDLARFINCSESTARKIKRDGPCSFCQAWQPCVLSFACLTKRCRKRRQACRPLFEKISAPKGQKSPADLLPHCFKKGMVVYRYPLLRLERHTRLSGSILVRRVPHTGPYSRDRFNPPFLQTI